MAPQNLEGHHNSILHYIGLIFEMEHVNSRVVTTGRHKWILLVERDASNCFLVELHSFVWL